MNRHQQGRLFAAVVSFAVLGGGFWACGPGYPDAVTGNFDFSKDAFSFDNFDDSLSGGKMTAPLAARMFGDAAVCARGAGASCEARPAAQVWIDEVNAQTSFGHSEGMAVLSLLMSMGKVSAADFGGESGAQLRLDDAALRAELTYWAATQKVMAVHAGDKKLTAKDALPFLATALREKEAGWRLLIAIRDANGFRAGHAVVPFGYFKGSEPGQFFLRVYDPNFPGEERRIELNVERNSWRYEGSPNAEQPRSYEGTVENGNLLYFSEVTARMGTFTPPFVDGFAASASGEIFVEGEGAQVGFQNGELKEVGGLLMPGAADCFCKAPTGITNVMVTGGGAKTVSVGADAGTLFAMSSTVAAKVEPQGAAAVTIDPDKKTVTYNSTSDGGTTLTTTTTNADGSQTTVTVTLDKSAAGVTIDASDPKNVKITADVSTSSTQVIVTTTVTQPDGSSQTSTSTGKTSGGNDIAINVDTSTGSSTVNSNVNYATCLNGTKDPAESDRDCGLFCNGQAERSGDGRCDVGKRCSKNEDCSYALASSGTSSLDFAGECISAVCSKISCDDGRKNGPELEVDCNPGVCQCGEDQSCGRDSHCKPSLYCYGESDGGVNGKCHAPTPHPLTIIGATSDSPVAVSVSLDGAQTYLIADLGSAGGGAVIRNLNAYQSLVVSFAPQFQSRYKCSFDRADAQGRWVWDRTQAPADFSNTLRCTRATAKVSYQANGTACPADVVHRTDAGIYVLERRPAAPSLTIGSLHPGVSVENWNTHIVNRLFDVGTGLISVTGPYDGGAAWSLTMTAPVEGDAFYQSYTDPAAQAAVKTLPPPERWRYACALNSAASGPFSGDIVARVSCTCTSIPRPDAGTDAGVADAGTDAGTDAGVADAGVDAGTVDAGSGPVCTTDSDCGTAADCYCGDSSGNCAGNSGRCGAGRFVASTPTTDGVAASGTFTVPTGCGQVRVSAWGAAGGRGEQSLMGFPVPNAGGAGGYVSGVYNVSAGQKFTVWVGNAGDVATATNSSQGVGSYFGTAANGGLGDGLVSQDTGGSGGGLTSLRHETSGGAALSSLVIPGGGGAGSTQPGKPAGDTGSGDLTTRGGGDAAAGSNAGGGGAGENGGSAGMTGAPGTGGSFGALPSGFTSTVGDMTGGPAGTSLDDYNTLCGGNAGKGATAGAAGSGCVVLRCLP